MFPSIKLNYWQWIAAFWSIAWPGFILGSLLLFFGYGGGIPEEKAGRVVYLILASNVIFFTGQVLCLPRLLRKKYRAFRVALVRGNGDTNPRLRPAEVGRVAFNLLWPQVAFVLAVTAVVTRPDSSLGEAKLRALSSLARWMQFLLIGPRSLRLALDAHYPAFRLVTHGPPSSIHPNPSIQTSAPPTAVSSKETSPPRQ